jgi:hypothetical protein
MSRRALVAALLLLAGAGAIVLPRLLRPPPSDEEQIRALLDGAARAAEEKRIGDAVEGLSESFQGQGLDKRGAKQLVAAHVLRGSWVSATISGAEVEVEGDAARAVVDVILSRSGKGARLADLLPEQATVHRFTLRLAREREGWKVTSAAWRPVSLEEAASGPALPPVR